MDTVPFLPVSLSSKNLSIDVKAVADQTFTSNDRVFQFGPFRLVPARQLLLEGATPVRLGSRALDILTALVEREGELVGKSELIARVWPDTVVEEGNLKAHVATLRKALGDGQPGHRYIATIPGRGYQFVAPVEILGSSRMAPVPTAGRPGDPPEAAPAFDRSLSPKHNLPRRLSQPIGRDEVIERVSSRVLRRRLVTLVGSGGIGKTTVALAAADRLLAGFSDGAWFVDLSPVQDPRLVPNAVASVLGVAIRSRDPYSELAAHLAERRLLILLDSCEHVVEAAAPLVEEILRSSPGVHVLATSREALRAEDERVERLLPLETASADDRLTAEEALTYPALRLFAERMAAVAGGKMIEDGDTLLVAQICRRLDGIALAIELAAGRVAAFGLRGVAERLDDRFRLLTHGRRTALPRHQTLAATLDWSYRYLSDDERRTLRRLGIFAGRFTLQAAATVAADETLATWQIEECIANLVDKSLISVDASGTTAYYRLLDTTRAYARERLAELAELEPMAQRHAEFMRDAIRRAEADWHVTPTDEWRAAYRSLIDDLRAALAWSATPQGDPVIAVALAAGAVPLWFELWLLEECRTQAEIALATLESGTVSDDRRMMQLYAAIALTQFYTVRASRDTASAWSSALSLSEALGDVDYQLRALWGNWGTHMIRGEFAKSLEFARRFTAVAMASPDPNERLIGDRLAGSAMHFLGDQDGARTRLESMLAGYVTPGRRSHAVRFQSEQRTTAHWYLARIYWLQGLADTALRAVAINVEEAVTLGHPMTLCNALAGAACPVTLLAGDLDAAGRYIEMLRRESATGVLEIWQSQSRCFEGELSVRCGDAATGLAQLRSGIEQLIRSGVSQYLPANLGMLAECLMATGEHGEARAAVDDAIARAARSGARWNLAELLRIKGEILVRSGDAESAEQEFLASYGIARALRTPAWELRTATSLARLRLAQGRATEAGEALAAAYRQLSEGLETHDPRAARSLLDAIAALNAK